MLIDNTLKGLYIVNIGKTNEVLIYKGLLEKVRSMATLSKNELEIMRLMWEEKRPFSRTEIIAASPERSWKDSSIHILLNSLLKKEAIAIDGFVRTGKNYGRTYVSAMTEEEYVAEQLTQNMPVVEAGGGSLSGVLEVLIRGKDVDLAVLNDLQEVLDRRKSELSK